MRIVIIFGMGVGQWARAVTAVGLVTGGGLLGGCGAGGATSTGSGRVAVVAAENFWGDIAAQVGGGHVAVRSIVSDPGTDPHLYESDAADAAAVAEARVVIENGAGYDDFMARLLGTGAAGAREVVSVQRVLGSAGEGVNPHFWYDVARVPTVAASIEAALVRADPSHGSDYRANLERFDASLGAVEAEVALIRARFSGAPVAYTERLPGYLLADAGLAVATPPGFASAIEDGNEPGPADTQAMDSLISGRGVKALVYNLQAVSRATQAVRSLAEAAGVPVVGVTETLPRGSSYQAWQLDEATALAGALEKGP